MQWFIDMIVAICNAYTDQAILDAKVIPSGTVILWTGKWVDIPDGWFFCDGDNGTPDLRDRFTICPGLTFNRLDVGGTITHVHTGESQHLHELSAGAGLGTGKFRADVTTGPYNIGNTGSAGTLPPYFCIIYIMKA